MNRLQIALSLAIATGLAPMAFSQGDDCGSTTPLSGTVATMLDTTVFTTSGFNGGGNCGFGANSINRDGFYQWTASAAGDYFFDTFGSNYDTKLSVHAGVGCAALCVGYNDDTQGLQSLVNVSGVQAGDTFLIQVGGFGSSSGIANLNIDMFIDPCTGAPDDAFEENETCGTATAIGNGTFMNLFASTSDTDNYAICVDPGGTLAVDINHNPSGANLNLYLWDATSTDCGMGNAGSGALAQGTNGGSFESIMWNNASASPLEVILQVQALNTGGSCNTYNMVVNGVGACGGPYVLDTFCDPMDVNSTGASTVLTASIDLASPTEVHLEATSGPPNQFGHFMVGTGASEPGIPVSQGRLCLAIAGGNAIGRYNVISTSLNSIGLFDAGGVMQNLAGTSNSGTGFDVPSSLPTPISGTLQSGTTYYFQMWHRENGGQSNFSNGSSVQF